MRRNRSSCRRKKPGRCPRRREYFDYYEEIVADYIREYRPKAAAELQDFRDRGTLEEVISRAAWCLTPDDKKHSHHWRRTDETLREAERALMARETELGDCRTFDDLHELVWQTIRPIKWVKRLYAYDVATWIGAKLCLEPELVYPHAGAGKGAKELGFDDGEPFDPALLPPAFHQLRPYEIEDCLCIYKDDLKRIANSILILFN